MTVYDYHITIDVGSEARVDPEQLRRILKGWFHKQMDGFGIEITVSIDEIPEEEDE